LSWVGVHEDGRISMADAAAIEGCDLWLCLSSAGGVEDVLRGYYYPARGFQLEHGELSGRRVTHYWVRDRPPPPPSKLDGYSGLW
jgi:hypothetical protein